MDWQPLLAAATAARQRSYSPFSGFAVGAALLAEDGRIFAGCNVENRSYGLALCAERVAVASAVVAGVRRFAAVAVVAEADPLAPPCGLCRETLAEFCPGDLPLLLAAPDGRRRETTLGELFPEPFVLPARPNP
jgi:cytidine deaminase